MHLVLLVRIAAFAGTMLGWALTAREFKKFNKKDR